MSIQSVYTVVELYIEAKDFFTQTLTNVKETASTCVHCVKKPMNDLV